MECCSARNRKRILEWQFYLVITMIMSHIGVVGCILASQFHYGFLSVRSLGVMTEVIGLWHPHCRLELKEPLSAPPMANASMPVQVFVEMYLVNTFMYIFSVALSLLNKLK